MDKKISFIIPAYNCENTLLESINSIIDNNFENGDEIIIVNDASTDNTKEVAENIKNKYTLSVKLINNEQNKGCPASRNIGIEEAENELIFNLDSDDILEKNSVKKLKDYLIKNNVDLATFGEIHFFINNTKKITHKWICKDGLMTLPDYLSGPIVPGGNYIYTKASWEKIGGYWEYGKGLHEFWGFTLKQLSNSSKVMVMPKSYYFHRYSHKSLYSRESKKISESIEVSNKFIEPILNLFDEKTQTYIKGNNDWFSSLNRTPLILKNNSVGKTGKIVYTSKLVFIKQKIKEILRCLNLLKK
jgi:glycosyltransferase involved in cell wall biosynthesis